MFILYSLLLQGVNQWSGNNAALLSLTSCTTKAL